jgi:catechol 2,3-dioxygenase-like lactoylglutathione lyase family enzyme
MIFKTIVPILYSRDIAASLAFYTGVLGFQQSWDFGDPPTFGGVCKDSVEVFFCKEGQGQPGTWLSIVIDKVDEYYETVKAKGAKTSGEPKSMEWGIREFLVEDPDGHIIRFGQNIPAAHQPRSGHALPASIRIIEKDPGNPAIVYCVAAQDTTTGQQVGSAQILGDNERFFYIKDVNVDPQWQGRNIGTDLMHALSAWLEKNAPGSSSVWLHSPEQLAPFYKQFGFTPVFGMARFFPAAADDQ